MLTIGRANSWQQVNCNRVMTNLSPYKIIANQRVQQSTQAVTSGDSTLLGLWHYFCFHILFRNVT